MVMVILTSCRREKQIRITAIVTLVPAMYHVTTRPARNCDTPEDHVTLIGLTSMARSVACGPPEGGTER